MMMTIRHFPSDNILSGLFTIPVYTFPLGSVATSAGVEAQVMYFCHYAECCKYQLNPLLLIF